MSKKIHHVHDGFFRVAMTNLKVAKDLLKAHLPKKLVKQIDWDTLQITNKSYVDQKLRQFMSDMVYKCTLQGREAYIFLLIEHVRHEVALRKYLKKLGVAPRPYCHLLGARRAIALC